MKHAATLVVILLLAANSAAADEQPLVKHLNAGQTPLKATINDIAWMQGHWKGDFLNGGVTEHIMPAPLFNQLPGLVRFYGDTIWANEVSLFVEREGRLDYVVRHFNNGLIALEPVDKPNVHSLIAIDGKHYYFDGITFVNDAPDQHTVYYKFPDGERKGEILTVIMRRQ